MKKTTINIGKDFSETPLGRFPEDGPFSGQHFRDSLLVPALLGNEQVIVQIDDVEGYGSSFLEEAFGGLVRKKHFSSTELLRKLIIETTSPGYGLYKDVIWKYIKEAR